MNRTAMSAERKSARIVNSLAILAILGYMLYNFVVLYQGGEFAQLSKGEVFSCIVYKGEAPLWTWVVYLSAYWGLVWYYRQTAQD